MWDALDRSRRDVRDRAALREANTLGEDLHFIVKHLRKKNLDECPECSPLNCWRLRRLVIKGKRW